MHLRRMRILLLLDIEFYRCLLGPSVLIHCSVPLSLLIFCLVNLSFGVSGVLKSPKMNVLHSISSFNSVSICFTYIGAPVLGAYIEWLYPLVGLSPLSLCSGLLYLLLLSLF